MALEFTKGMLTKECVSNRNILELCYSKILDKNIIKVIKSYLIEYKYGLSLFKNGECFINNKFIYKNLIKF